MELNATHPLFGNLKFLVGVDESNSLVDLVTPSRAFTVAAEATYGAGSYGRHFRTAGSGASPKGASFSPAFQPANNTGTLIVVVNGVASSNSSINACIVGGSTTSSQLYLPRLGSTTSGTGWAASVRGTGNEISSISASPVVDSAPKMVAFTRDGETSHKIYVNAVEQVSGGKLGATASSGLWTYIGGTPTMATINADIVWIAWFDVVLTPTQISDLYASLGANNAFALVESGAATPVTFSGSVANQTGTEGAAFSLDLSTFFTGTETPFAYSVQTGALPAGLSLNSSTGVISGTPTIAGVSSGIVIRATDATPDTADTNSFSITINAANTSPSFTGPNIADISGTEGAALTPVDVSAKFYDAESGLTFSAVGSWPAGVTVSSAGVISGTPTTAGTYASLQVRATDAGSLTADSNAFTITVAAPATTDGTITVGSALYPIKYTSASVLNESGLRATVLDATTLAAVLNTSGVVCSNGVITITDAALVIGGTYHLAVKTANGWTGFSDVVTAS